MIDLGSLARGVGLKMRYYHAKHCGRLERCAVEVLRTQERVPLENHDSRTAITLEVKNNRDGVVGNCAPLAAYEVTIADFSR